MITGADATGNVIVGNFIGTNIDGTQRIDNVDGVALRGSATGNRIGGTTAGERNVISGNRRFNVVLGSSFSDPDQYNDVQGNYIGTDATGMQSLGRTTAGIALVSDHNSVIGGAEPGAGT